MCGKLCFAFEITPIIKELLHIDVVRNVLELAKADTDLYMRHDRYH